MRNPSTWLAAGLLAQLLPAQQLPAPSVSVSRGCGLQEEDGVLWGLGPDYKVRFEDDGFEFTPALGSRVPHNLPLRFRLTEVGRHEARGPLAATPTAAPVRTHQGLRVRYPRGSVVETYEVRPEGIEQSFVFETLPPGRGDLVVRGRIETELAVPAAGTAGDALEFVRAGAGGVRISDVVGIDATGARQRGTLAWYNGTLELRLPAAFVEAAALPLVLDPLIGSTIAVASGYDEASPDVAAPITDTYLVVWARRFSDNDVDIRGQRVNSEDGTLQGGLIGIRTSSTHVSDLPRVAMVLQRFRWVVVFRERLGTNPTYIAACSVDANGAVSTAIQVVAGTDSYTSPDVGGDTWMLGDRAIAVYHNATQARIEKTSLTIATTGALSGSGHAIISSTGTHQTPTIAPDVGRDGRFMAVWTTYSGLNYWIAGAVLSATGGVLERLTITPTGGTVEVAPDVAGDGVHWMVVYDRSTEPGQPADIYCRWVTWDPATAASYLGNETLVAGGTDSQTGAAVVCFLNSTLVAYRDLITTARYGTHVRSLDLFTCGPCEGLFDLDVTSTRSVARVAVGGGPFAAALSAWETVDPATGSGEIRARRYQYFGGGTGLISPPQVCGVTATSHGSCARIGNGGFHLRLEHAEPGRPAFLLLTPSLSFPPPRTLSCGTSCSILDPFRGGFVLPAGVTDIHGNASVSLPILGNQSSAQVAYQFGLLPSGTPGCPVLGLSFSALGSISAH